MIISCTIFTFLTVQMFDHACRMCICVCVFSPLDSIHSSDEERKKILQQLSKWPTVFLSQYNTSDIFRYARSLADISLLRHTAFLNWFHSMWLWTFNDYFFFFALFFCKESPSDLLSHKLSNVNKFNREKKTLREKKT